MKLPYWLQPGSQQFIDYLALVNEMDYPDGVIGHDRAVYPNRAMAHHNAMRRFVNDMPPVPTTLCLLNPIARAMFIHAASFQEQIDANLF